jgi:poly(hydroxyalkanoate) granule-associated protein
MLNVAKMEHMVRELPGEVVNTGRQVWLATLGTAGVVGNTVQSVFGALVEEGAKLQKTERKRINRLVDDLVDTANDRVKWVGHVVEDNVQATTKLALGRLGLPSRKDVSDLMARVDVLAAKVETLKARRGAVHGR